MTALAPLLLSLYAELGIEKGPATPAGVCARAVAGRILYVNTTGEEKVMPIAGSRRGVIHVTVRGLFGRPLRPLVYVLVLSPF